MIHPSYAELMKVVNEDAVEIGEEPVVNSRYSIVIAAAKRARQLIDGAETQIEHPKCNKPLSIAVEELYCGDVKIVTVKRDDKYIANLEKEEEDFWNCVKNCVIPDSCLKQDEIPKIKDKFDVMPSAAIDNLILSLDKEHIEKIVNLESRKQEISSRMKNAVKKIDEAIDTLKLPLFADFLNRNINNGEVIEEGFRIAIETKISETVDYSALKKENPEFYKKYLKKPKVSQKITVDAL